MPREIFVGSSTEGIEHANYVSRVLSADADIKCVPWTEVFEVGYLTLEALEAVLTRCCGAVFVATPDDQTVIRQRAVQSPRANIMLEFGLMAGRMGRHNIALCQFGGAELPSDLRGLTVVAMDDGATVDPLAKKQAEEKLRNWSSQLSETADTIPRTQIVHGYTGRWDFILDLQRWRDVWVVAPGYVQVKGYLDLVMPADGQTGRGLAHGGLYFRLPGEGGHTYQGEYRTAHEVTNALCLKDGSLELTTEAFAIQRISAVGVAPGPLADIEFSPEPWTAKWQLVPRPEPRTLEGTVHTDGAVVSTGRVKVAKSFVTL